MSDIIIVKSDFDRFGEWQAAFAKHDIEAVPWQDLDQRASDINYALVWKPRPGSLQKITGLELIFSVGAGVDHLKGDGIVPPKIPVIRMVENSLTSGMVEYVVYNVLRFHRDMGRYEENQRSNLWQPHMQIPAWECNVGILGLGVLGGACAQALRDLNFNVVGWSNTEKNIDGVKSYFGKDHLDQFLDNCQILVSLLPLTDATRNIINREFLSRLPQGSYVINAGRGPLLVEQDLVEALDSGHLAAAALDVFVSEPLPGDSLLWRHPGVTITPHVASITLPTTSVEHVVNNIRRHRQGLHPTHIADLSRGY